MKYTVYVIQDERGKKYTGYTKDIDRRLWEHNNAITKSTRKGKSWRVVYFEEYCDKSQAIIREKYLKTGKGRDFIDEILKTK